MTSITRSTRHTQPEAQHSVDAVDVVHLGNGYMLDGYTFFSYQEVQCFRYLRSLGVPPGKMHREYRVGKSRFDFFPLKRVFWEHHPISKKLRENIYSYGESRRAVLDSNGYSHIPLVVSDIMFQSIPDLTEKMALHGVDFRTGAVPEAGIIYIRTPERNPPTTGFNVLCETLAMI